MIYEFRYIEQLYIYISQSLIKKNFEMYHQHLYKSYKPLKCMEYGFDNIFKRKFSTDYSFLTITSDYKL